MEANVFVAIRLEDCDSNFMEMNFAEWQKPDIRNYKPSITVLKGEREWILLLVSLGELDLLELVAFVLVFLVFIRPVQLLVPEVFNEWTAFSQVWC